MKSLRRLACLGAAVVAFAACEEDHVSIIPTFSGFRIEPLVWNAGDSVTITAVQLNKGDMLYEAEYHWRVACEDTVFTKIDSVVYDADKSDPYFGFRLPADFKGRKAEITFNAEYDCSSSTSQLAPGGSGSTQPGLYGRITTSVASQLYGMGSGTYTHTW